MTQNEDNITDTRLYQAFQLMRQKDYDGAEACIQKGLKDSTVQKNATLLGLYHSALGVLFKLRGDFKSSYKHYQQAEKLIPEDDSLKIISALLLVEEFHQYDTAIRKLIKVIEGTTDPAVLHHALAISGLAFAHSKRWTDAEKILQKLLKTDFSKLRSAANVDFKFIEAMAGEKRAIVGCKQYLEKALQVAKTHKETVYQNTIEELLQKL